MFTPSNVAGCRPIRSWGAIILAPLCYTVLAANTNGCEEPTSMASAQIEAIDLAGSLVAPPPAAKLGASTTAQLANLYVTLYDCGARPTSFPQDQATVVSEGFPWPMAPDQPLFLPGLAMAGTYCYSGEVEVDNGQVFRTQDLLTGVDGQPFYSDPGSLSVDLAYNTIAALPLPVWEQVDFSDDTEISWEKTIEVEMTDEWIAEINSLASPQFQMRIRDCLAYGQDSLDMTISYQANKGLLVGTDSSSVFLLNDAMCTLEVFVLDGAYLRAEGSVAFEAPPGNGIPVKIDDLPLEIHDAQIEATFTDEGNHVNMVFVMPPGLLDYLDGFNQDLLRYESAWQQNPTYAHPDAQLVPLSRDGAELSGTAEDLDNADYRVTLTIYEGNEVIIQAVDDVDLTVDQVSAHFEWDYSVIVTSDVENLTNVYAHAWLEGSDASGGISVHVEGVLAECVPGVCPTPHYEVSCVTGASIDPSTGEQNPDTGANTCLVRVPFGTIERVTLSQTGYVTEILEQDILVKSLDSINLPNVILEKI